MSVLALAVCFAACEGDLMDVMDEMDGMDTMDRQRPGFRFLPFFGCDAPRSGFFEKSFVKASQLTP